MSWCAWSQIAFTTAGWQWPVLQTAMPATQSIYSFPSASHTFEPSPLTMAISRENAGI